MRLSLPRRGEIGPDRLSALDLSNLRVEEHGTSMHMAALMLLDGGPLLDEHVSVAASVRRPGETGGNRAGVRLATVPVNDPDATSRPETVAARTRGPAQTAPTAAERTLRAALDGPCHGIPATAGVVDTLEQLGVERSPG